jgi:hypothetical protein
MQEQQQQTTTPVFSNAAEIKKYFAHDNGRAVSMEELKALSKEERDELGMLAHHALTVLQGNQLQ